MKLEKRIICFIVSAALLIVTLWFTSCGAATAEAGAVWAIQPCTHRGDCCTCRRWDAEKLICRGEAFGIERPPQSWCYVENSR